MENTIRNVVLVAALSAMWANTQGSPPVASPALQTGPADFLGAIRNNDLKSMSFPVAPPSPRASD
jgi:hypothetical protein